MPYVVLADETRLYYELTGPEDGPVVIQFGGGLFGRHNFGAVNDGFRDNGFQLLSFDARGYGASSTPREQYTIEMWARRRSSAPRDPRARAGARPWHVDGRHDRDRVCSAPRRPRDRDLRRCRLRQAGCLPSDAVPPLAQNGGDDDVGRLLGPRHDAGRRRRLPRERGGRGHLRPRACRDRLERPLYRASGVHRDGGNGPLASRAADLDPAPDDERHVRHPLPARSRAIRPGCPEDGGA